VKGRLYGVGVGPGDPELLTLKAVRILRACPVIAAPDAGGDQLALAIAGEHIKDKELLLCRLPMTRDPEVLSRCRGEAAAQLCAVLAQGRDVAFLTLGDPSVYATYSYLHRLVRAAGYEALVVPGVPSFCAAAAALGEPLCEGEQALHILPAAPELDRALEQPGTKVIMKMGRRREETLALLERQGLLERSAMVERCTMPGETVVRDLSQAAGDGYFALVVVREED